jgi:ion channel-forming bestrophin family protein
MGPVSQAAPVERLGRNHPLGSAMHVGKSYKLPELLRWTRRRLCVLLILSAVPVIAWHLGAHVPLPWAVAALLGTAASFIVGFKNAQVYSRHMEAQQVWMAIAATSRYWALACRDFPKAPDRAQALVTRHLAWLACLRFFARDPRPWESTARHWNAEYQHRNFRVPEREACLDEELGRYTEQENGLAGRAQSAWSLVARQSATLRAMADAQEVSPAQCIEMQKTLKDMLDQQARLERIKDFPYPRQYATINSIFVWCFVAVLPLALVREFARLAADPGGAPAALLPWLAIPASLLVGWLYLSLDQVGESTENPFEGTANDVPVSHICRAVENDLLDLLQRERRPVNEAGSATILI